MWGQSAVRPGVREGNGARLAYYSLLQCLSAYVPNRNEEPRNGAARSAPDVGRRNSRSHCVALPRQLRFVLWNFAGASRPCDGLGCDAVDNPRAAATYRASWTARPGDICGDHRRVRGRLLIYTRPDRVRCFRALLWTTDFRQGQPAPSDPAIRETHPLRTSQRVRALCRQPALLASGSFLRVPSLGCVASCGA